MYCEFKSPHNISPGSPCMARPNVTRLDSKLYADNGSRARDCMALNLQSLAFSVEYGRRRLQRGCDLVFRLALEGHYAKEDRYLAVASKSNAIKRIPNKGSPRGWNPKRISATLNPRTIPMQSRTTPVYPMICHLPAAVDLNVCSPCRKAAIYSRSGDDSVARNSTTTLATLIWGACNLRVTYLAYP